MSNFIIFLVFGVISASDILPNDNLDNDARLDDFSQTLDDGFTTKDGVEVTETSKHWLSNDKEDNAGIQPGTPLSSIHGWTYTKDNTIPKLYAMDPDLRNVVRRNVKFALYSSVNSTAFKGKVQLAAFSKDVLSNILVMDPELATTPEFVHIFSGNGILDGRQPVAHRYGGHQFGVWAEQLGDGRAVTIGEVRDNAGNPWEVQLKGAGKTPYSRDGDGRAVLRSSIREFLASEALHYLGVPTSRAGSIIVSEDRVRRDMFYNGNIKEEKTAVVMRLARSWLRFGSLELMSKNGEYDLLRITMDTIIRQHYPDIDPVDPERYVTFFKHVMESTLLMIVKWMTLGFAHGVMNTDNFSIHGITIDYGPFRFLDAYHEDVVPNTSDDEARYAFHKQPYVARQNLQYLADALSPVLDTRQREQLKKMIDSWDRTYQFNYMLEMRKKLGVDKCSRDEDFDRQMVDILLTMMQDTGADFTMTFRDLSDLSYADIQKTPLHISDELWSLKKVSAHKNWNFWLRDMYYTKLMELRVPNGKTDEARFNDFRKRNPNWTDEKRLQRMKQVNPRYVLRNWMAEEVIQAAEHNDFQPLSQLLSILSKPYTKQSIAEDRGYSKPPPVWAQDIKVSCSS